MSSDILLRYRVLDFAGNGLSPVGTGFTFMLQSWDRHFRAGSAALSSNSPLGCNWRVGSAPIRAYRFYRDSSSVPGTYIK